MNGRIGERRLLFMTYLLTLAIFINLAILKSPIDMGALIMGGIICVLMTYAYIVIRKFFPDGDKYILIFSCIFCSIGIGMIYRINASLAIRQVIWFTLSMAGFILLVVMLPNLKTFSTQKYRYIYLITTMIFMAMATFIGKETLGAKNWVSIGPFGFQPSEIGKLFLAAYLAAALKDYKGIKTLIEPGIVVMASLGFMVLQRDLGSALMFFGMTISMLYIATSKGKYIIICFILFAIGSVLSYKFFSHVQVRVDIWLNPWKYANGKGYQLVQSLIAIASGGFFGLGLGQGHPSYVPVAESDFIFSAICEEFGILVGFGIMILYFLFFYRCIRAAIYSKDKFSQLLAVGYSSMIACQTLVIIGGVVGAVPLTGITLPLMSQGGSSMFAIFFALGILQKISEDA